MLHSQGRVQEVFIHWCRQIVSECEAVNGHIRADEARETDKQEKEKKRKMQMSDIDLRRELAMDQKNETIERLRRVGVKMSDPSEQLKETTTPQTVKIMLDRADNEQAQNERLFLDAIRRMRRTCLGLSSIEIISGSTKLSLAFSGADVFDLVPEPPSK